MPLGKGIGIWDVVTSARMDANATGSIAAGWNKLAVKDKCERIADVCADLGLNWVQIKATDGQYLFNRRYDEATKTYVDDVLPLLVAALKVRKIEVWGWGFSYGGYWAKITKAVKKKKGQLVKQNGKICYPNGVNEGRAAAQRVIDLDLAGWLIDAENTSGDAWMLGGVGKQHIYDYITTMRSLIGADIPISSNTYRMPDHQTYMPWETMLDMVDMDCPQVYWVGQHNPALQLEKSWKMYKVWREKYKLDAAPYVPEGACYADENSDWTPTVADIEEFFAKAIELGLPGVTFWALDEAGGVLERPDLYQVMKSLTWPGASTPTIPVEEPVEEPEPVKTWDSLSDTEKINALHDGAIEDGWKSSGWII